MAGRTLLYGGAGASSNVNPILIQRQRVPCSSSESHDSIFMPASSSSFLGSRSMVSFEDVNGRKRSEKTFYGSFDQEDNGDEDYNDYLHQPEKKRRLTVEQVQFLERSFELENKLEPERKIELAKELGLQPRQIAIWFQNRRARWKNKQLEKDYDVLRTSYDNLKADYDNLLEEKEKLKAEVAQMTGKLLLKERESGNAKLSYRSNLSAETTKDPSADSVSEGEVSKVSALALNKEDLSSAKSDVLDSDSPCHTDGVQSSILEWGDSSYVFEPDQSDMSQDEEDKISKNPVRPDYGFPKIEDACYSDPPSSSYFGFPVEDQAFGFWQYN